MKKRVLGGAVMLILCTAAVLVATVSGTLQSKVDNHTDSLMRSLVAGIAASLPEVEDFQAAADELAASTGMRVTFVSSGGNLLADSETVAFDTGMLGREEIVQARVNGVGSSTRSSNLVGKRMRFAAALTPYGYYIRIARENRSVVDNFIAALPAVLLALGLLVLLVIPVSHLFTGSILRPITEFSTALDSVMEGGDRLEPDLYPYEELQSMALSINHLSDEVDKGLHRVESEHKKLDTILDSMKEGFLMLSWDEEVLLINDRACRILGFVKGTGYDNLVYVTRDIDLLDAVAEVKKTGAVRQVEYSDAYNSYYEVTISPTSPDPDTGSQGIVMLLSERADTLGSARMQQEFFQAASHELKTPITSVRGFTELLLSDTGLDEEMRSEYAVRILRETQRMQTLIEDILMIARMESGELRYEREDLDLAALVGRTCNDIRSLAAEQEITVSCECEPCRMYASKKEMEELVGNLVSNALKYNRRGGRIEVRLWLDEGSPILNIFNSGEAIPDHETERIFERFYRIDKGRSKAVGGTGLGLAIVHHIVVRYGAKISVLPAPGVGNTFQVAFPPSLLVSR